MFVRMSLVGAVAALAISIVSPAFADPPRDAHDRQSTVATIQDSHDRYMPVATQPRVIGDAHERGTPASDRPTVIAGSGDFDWGDAAIGALTGMGFALVLGGLAFLTIGKSTRLAMR